MFGSKFFNEIKGSQPLEKEIVKEVKKVSQSSKIDVEELDKPIVFDVVKNNK